MIGIDFGFFPDELTGRSGIFHGREVQDATSNPPEKAPSASAREMGQAGLSKPEVQALKFQNARLKVANSRLLEANAKLPALTTTDYLTGIANHRGFQERLSGFNIHIFSTTLLHKVFRQNRNNCPKTSTSTSQSPPNALANR